MGDKTDRASGKLKEGAGRVTGDADLEREGRAEQGKGELKQSVEKAKGGLKKTVS
jgi:uncharacterized protein YjbJ (UPF0337 family)